MCIEGKICFFFSKFARKYKYNRMTVTKKDNKPKNPVKKTTPAKTKATGSTNTKRKATSKNAQDTDDEASREEIIRFSIGGLLCLFALFVFFAIISYIFTGVSDAKYVMDNDGYFSPENWLGKLGAIVAYFCVEETLGFASLFIIVFIFMAGLRIMDTFKIRLWKWFINCGILACWFSCLLAVLTTESSMIKMGGMTGKGIMERLDEGIGPFRYIVLLVTAIAYLCYLSTETIRIIRRMIQKPVELIQQHINKDEGEEVMVGDEKGTLMEDGNVLLSDGTIVTPDGEIVGNASDKQDEDEDEDENVNDEKEPELVWEFRGGEDGPDHPAPAEVDKNAATTIVFNVEGKDEEQNKVELPPMAEQLDLFVPNDILTVSQGEQEEPIENLEKSNEGDTEMTITIGEENEKAELTDEGALEPYDPKLDLENYRYPTLDLLKHYDIDTRAVDMDEQKKNSDKIITVLRNFGVEISSIKATVGPTITLYEITPAPGVKISKIRNLEDDIALSLAALGIRIIAPIPGKGTIGIEVPNAKPQMVSMESIVNSKKFQECDYELPMALGKTITNEIFMADLAKMPHLLVAGATGQGKSVGLNAIITSLLYKKHPAELKIVMVDPKKVEFSVYNPIVNHFLAQVEGNEENEEPIITDVTKVIQTLKSLCQEMDTRYDLLKKARARNVKEYNEKFKARQLSPLNGHKFMPYIVVIIDEFGDLIMTAGKEIELPIARIAQLARAVGIHMIIATQRPTTNIITGTIKANFPARMAFRVGAMVDSRTILDRPGANQLVGKGDMLFQSGTEPVRVQCAFVDTPEVENIASFIACQQSYNAPFPLPYVEMEGADGDAPDVDMNHLDPMFEDVARLIVSTQQGSTSMIQRKFSIGYNRAGRLMDQMEVAGIVGPAHGSKPREVLCQTEDELNFKLDSLRG